MSQANSKSRVLAEGPQVSGVQTSQSRSKCSKVDAGDRTIGGGCHDPTYSRVLTKGPQMLGVPGQRKHGKVEAGDRTSGVVCRSPAKIK